MSDSEIFEIQIYFRAKSLRTFSSIVMETFKEERPVVKILRNRDIFVMETSKEDGPVAVWQQRDGLFKKSSGGADIKKSETDIVG